MGNNIEIINDKIVKDKSLLIDNLESGFLEFNKELINSLDFNFLNLTDSKLLIDELILFKINDLSLKNLYSANGNPDLIDLLNARIEIIILSANRINPIYFNSISALAQYFQKIIAQDSKDQIQVSLDIFFDEFDAATEIHELIELNL